MECSVNVLAFPKSSGLIENDVITNGTADTVRGRKHLNDDSKADYLHDRSFYCLALKPGGREVGCSHFGKI